MTTIFSLEKNKKKSLEYLRSLKVYVKKQSGDMEKF